MYIYLMMMYKINNFLGRKLQENYMLLLLDLYNILLLFDNKLHLMNHMTNLCYQMLKNMFLGLLGFWMLRLFELRILVL